MHPLATSSADNRKAARGTLAEAGEFRQTSRLAIEAQLFLPAISNLHETARLAVTAVATLNGRRFSNTAGTHEAVVDYAIGVDLVSRADYALLDQLRQLRHSINYPSDMIAPGVKEIEAITKLVDRIVTAATARIPPLRVPPPPRR